MLVFGVPSLAFIIFCYTPAGKKWRKDNGLL